MTEASTSKTMRNVLIAISVIMFVVVVILGAILLWLWYRSRQKTKNIPIKEAGIDNKNYVDDDP